MGRPLGSKNLTPKERMQQKKSTKKVAKKTTNDTPSTPEAKPVTKPEQSQDPVLAAIQGLSSKFDSRMDEFEQRLSAVEGGQPSANPVTGGEYIPNRVTPATGLQNPVGTMVADYVSPLPTHDPSLMESIKLEADAVTRAKRLDKVGVNPVMGSGRSPKIGRYDVECVICHKKPTPPPAVPGGPGGRGVMPYELDQQGNWKCESCITGGTR